jgi:hypothetical protein
MHELKNLTCVCEQPREYFTAVFPFLSGTVANIATPNFFWHQEPHPSNNTNTTETQFRTSQPLVAMRLQGRARGEEQNVLQTDAL